MAALIERRHTLNVESTMTSISDTKALLAQHGTLESQPATDWRGDFALPVQLEEYYREIGPLGDFINDKVGYSGVSIPTVGNPFDLPPLAKLWDLQAGYRWHGITGQRLEDWDDMWLVIASQGGDPFIFQRETGEILFAQHGGGVWNPSEIFTDITTMTACLATIGQVCNEAEDDLLTEDETVNPVFRAILETRLTTILGDASAAVALADLFEW